MRSLFPSAVWILEDELERDAVCHQFYVAYTVSTLPRNLLNGSGLQNRGTISCIVKHTCDLVPPNREGPLRQGMTDRVTEMCSCYGRKLCKPKSVGRPKTRWQVVIQKDALQVLGIQGWRRWGGDREKRKCHLNEARARKRLHCHIWMDGDAMEWKWMWK
jgi:hypothetical protein